jgi:hypothetical protein
MKEGKLMDDADMLPLMSHDDSSSQEGDGASLSNIESEEEYYDAPEELLLWMSNDSDG